MSRQKYTIYLATCKTTKKCYVGFDSNWPHRKYEHEASVLKPLTYKSKFRSALKKYGIDDFKWKVLQRTYDKDYALNTLEERYIRKYESHWSEGGYNMTYGGDGSLGRVTSNATRKKMSKMRRGVKLSEAHKEKLRKYTKELHPCWGKKRSEESKRKQGETFSSLYSGVNSPKYGKLNRGLSLANKKRKGQVCVNNGKINRMVWPTEIPRGFSMGQIRFN